MSAELLPTIAKAASEAGLLKDIYGDLAKPGVTQVGKALSTVIGLGNTLLWPIQLLNEKSRVLLEANLERYREKLSQVPPEKISPVAAELEVPIAERLSFTQDVDLRELYTTLLAKASIIDAQKLAHPSFVNVINNLSPDEAKLLKQLKADPALPFVGVKLRNPENKHWAQLADLIGPSLPAITLTYEENMPAYLSNLEGLGLVTARRDSQVIPQTLYDPIESGLRERFKDVSLPGFTEWTFERGRIDVTKFGHLFIEACVE